MAVKNSIVCINGILQLGDKTKGHENARLTRLKSPSILFKDITISSSHNSLK